MSDMDDHLLYKKLWNLLKKMSWHFREIVYCGESAWLYLSNFKKMCFKSYIKIIQGYHEWKVLHMVTKAGPTSGRQGKILHFLSRCKEEPPSCFITSVGMVCKTLAKDLCWFHWSVHGKDVLHCCGCPFQVARGNTNDFYLYRSNYQCFTSIVCFIWSPTTIGVRMVHNLHQMNFNISWRLMEWNTSNVPYTTHHPMG